MTQTVELSDGRSENEGGAIVTPDPPVRVSGSPVPPTTEGPMLFAVDLFIGCRATERVHHTHGQGTPVTTRPGSGSL